MKEEDNLLRRVGTGCPFSVPDGYLEGLPDQIMASLPEREPQPQAAKVHTISMWDRMKPWLYMAAMFVGAALIIRVASQPAASDEAQTAVMLASDDSETDMVYINAVMDDSMLDSYSLYVLLSDADGY